METKKSPLIIKEIPNFAPDFSSGGSESEPSQNNKSEGCNSIDYDAMNFQGMDIGFDIGSPIIERIRKGRYSVKNKLDQFRLEQEKLGGLVNRKKTVPHRNYFTYTKELQKAAKKPMVVRLRDKVSFTLGVTDVALTMFLLGFSPEHFHQVYSIKLPLLFAIRLYFYRQEKFHYFLFDFCYFANILLFAYLNFFPQSCLLFKINFSFTCGPLAFAIIAWRNSMVFHSLDKVTSIFIHMTPTLAVWSLRWNPPSGFNVCQADGGKISFVDATLLPIIPYIIWQLAYYVKVQLLDEYKFKRDPKYMTSFKYFIAKKKELVYKIINAGGPSMRIYIFGAMQLLYTFVTMLPVKLFFQYYWLHTFYLFSMCVASCWNGANFYMEVFSVQYQQSLKECEKQWEELSKAIQLSHQENVQVPVLTEVEGKAEKKEL